MRPVIYALFVLGELMVQPMYGSFLQETARRILGPFRPLSWGIISPLIRRLQQLGLATCVIDPPLAAETVRGRGQPRQENLSWFQPRKTTSSPLSDTLKNEWLPQIHRIGSPATIAIRVEYS